MFILGACFAGRIVVGLNYTVEQLRPKFARNVVFYFCISEPILLILLTVWYQFIDHAWLTIAIITLVVQTLCIAYFYFVVPESPKWLYTWKRFDEARQVLKYIASFNGVDLEEYERAVLNKPFLKENVVVGEAEERDEADSKSVRTVGNDMKPAKYYKNLVILSIIWTVGSFSFYLMNFMNKHYEGNIFLNFYLEGVGLIIGCLIA